eukprot:scaffold92658_cov15-Prasinocladus_malaysianus.AAC.1
MKKRCEYRSSRFFALSTCVMLTGQESKARGEGGETFAGVPTAGRLGAFPSIVNELHNFGLGHSQPVQQEDAHSTRRTRLLRRPETLRCHARLKK